jgi:regulator of RNase E activity RraA
MYQGWVEWGGHSIPVEIGGQRVNPEDLGVADGDGAIVVPEAVIDDVLTQVSTIRFAHDKGAAAATEHLLGHGYRDVALSPDRPIWP